MALSTQLRIIYIWKILERYSDDDHPLSASQINQILEKEHGFSAHRTTVYNDIEALKAYGIDIVTIRSTQNRYFIGSRVLETPQLRLLTDAIQSSKCLTAKKSRELIDRLMTLVSVHQATVIKQHAEETCVPKPQNESIYYIIDTVNTAIEHNKVIRFAYTEYTPQKERVLRGGGEIYTLSPLACVWSGDYYYVVGWSEKHRNVTAFRIDRIAGTPEIGEECRILPPNDFDITEYCQSVFYMYNGEFTTVELLCDNEMMKAVIDRFSEDVETTIFDNDHFIATVKVALSPTFYAWVFEFAGKIRLHSPAAAIDEFRQMLQAASI